MITPLDIENINQAMGEVFLMVSNAKDEQSALEFGLARFQEKYGCAPAKAFWAEKQKTMLFPKPEGAK